MQPNEMEVVLAQIVETLALLCNQAAELVDEYSTRLVRGNAADIRLKADQLRVSGRLLRTTLRKALEGKD
jgi:hypothetical protein